MGIHSKENLKKSAGIAFMGLALAGCASTQTAQVINPGDRVGIHFTCRLPNGAIAISSEKDVSGDQLMIKAPFFRPRATDNTLEVVAGPAKAVHSEFGTGFENDVLQGIASNLPGLKSGETQAIELVSSKSDHDHLSMNRIHHMEKERVVSIEDFKSHTHFDPALGETVEFEDSLPGVVKEIKEGNVTLDFAADEGAVVTTPFGPGKLRDAGKRYDVVIDVKEGDLVRMGPLVGRVRSVDERNFDLDFSRTFGGQDLHCDVTAEIAKPAVEQAPAAVASAESATAQVKADSAGTDAASATEQKSDAASPKDAVALPGKVAKGDLVTVRFTAKDSSGALLTLPEDMPKQGTPQEIIAGNQELFPGMGDAVIGMAPGEKKEITLPPEKAYGSKDSTKTATFPVKNTMPAKITMPADEYVKRFGGFPTAGKELQLAPYLTARVESIGEKDVTLAVIAKDGSQYEEAFGTVTVTVGKDDVTMKLTPKVGAPFNTGDRQGTITSSDGEKFTVDFNHPLAGKTIVVDLTVESVTRAADLKAAPIDWIVNHDEGLAEAKKEKKPLFLLLYADWCHWCQKTQSETLTDPRIEKLRDRFVWMKLNSDKEKKYKQEFGQNGFPMMVVLGPDGTVLKKIDGYRDASKLAAELKAVL